MTATFLPASGEEVRADRVAPLAEFRARCERVAGRKLAGEELHAFSIEEPAAFWRTLLEWTAIPWSGSADVVLTGEQVATARFFPDVRLNYAEALLRPLPGVDDDRPALTSVHAGRPPERYSRRELRAAVERTAAALEGLGLRSGDRMVLVAPNHAGAVVAALAAAALGATISTATPDMGAPALVARFAQVEAGLLLIDRGGMPTEGTAQLVDGLPTLRRVVLLDDAPLPALGALPVDRLAVLLAGVDADARTAWPRLPFDHPLFVMFSSGTTGPPKAMVHGAGGTLLEHVKEHRLHGGLSPADTLYFHTTTAWMMWNWQLSALAVGAHVVVYDGPVAGPETLWELAAELGVTLFGTSPAYLQLCEEAGYRPAAVDLSRLRALLPTGAVLHDRQFDWVAAHVGPVPVQSISGGTDIIGCFVLGHPERPVRRGRCQARSLGLDVAAVDADGREVVGRVGDLVCRRPFPSRPLGFLQDPDGSRFHEAYFAQHPDVWTHGDLVEFDADGSARMHGRSDGVLNVDGVRIGPSEIYTVLAGLPGIADAMAVEQRDPRGRGRSRMVLLVVLRPGIALDGELDRTIRRTLRREASAAHVPALVVAVPELPLTHNGKKSERAARDAVHGDVVPNATALRNPECLAGIRAAVENADRRAGEAADVPAATSSHADLLAALGRIWRDRLGLPEAEPDDDFADLGGTSRQVMSLLRRVRVELGIDVPVQEFLRAPTLRGLAAAAAAARAEAAPDVVLLRAGTGRPLFVLGDAWGQLNGYAALVERLDTRRPVYGVRLALTGPDGGRLAVPALAEQARIALRAVQSTGPYRLLGYSFGGLVAYQLAVLLRGDGEQVRLLGLIDVWPPRAALTRGEAAARRWAGRVETVFSPDGPGAVVRRLREKFRRSAADAERRVFVGSWSVADGYRPPPYAGAVTYFLAERRLPVVGNSLAAWRRVAPHLLVTEVPGCHWDLLGERFVDELAARVSAVLA